MGFTKIKQELYATFKRDDLPEGFYKIFQDEGDSTNRFAVSCERNGLFINIFISFNGYKIVRRNALGCFWQAGPFKSLTFLSGMLEDLGYYIDCNNTGTAGGWQKTL